MRFRWLAIKNFKSYGDYTTRIDLDSTEAQLLLGDNGCLSGETVISFNRCKKGFKKTLEKAYKSWNGLSYQGSRGEWDKTIPTYVRSCKEDKKEISLHKIKNIVYSGKKEVFLLTTEDYKQIKATANHEFLTNNGWKRLDEIRIKKDGILIDEINPLNTKNIKKKSVDKEIYGIKYHKYAKKITWDSKINSYKDYYRLPEHRLIFEANKNKLSFEKYVYVLRNDKEKSKSLFMYDPAKFDVHHINENHYNNDASNLKLMGKKRHVTEHGKKNGYKNFGNFSLIYKKVISIETIGEENTYDIICEEPYRNFSANGIIVHNSGKTTFIDAIIWCLYGKSLASTDKVVNRKIKKNCKVEINFDKSGYNYSVIRFRNHDMNKNSVLIFQDGENISPRTMNEAQDLILDIIEVNYNAMVSSIIFSSELYISFLRARPSARLSIFENILSLREIQQYYDIVKKLRKPIGESLNDFNSDKEKCEIEIESTSGNIDSYKEKVKNSLLDLKNKKESLEKERMEIDFDLETLSNVDAEKELEKNKTNREATEQNEETQKNINEEMLKCKDLESLTNELTGIKNNLENIKNIDADDELRKRAEYDSIFQHNLLVESQIREQMAKIIDADAIKTLENSITTGEISIKESIEYIKELEENSETCPTCGQEVSKELTERLIKETKFSLEKDTRETKAFKEILEQTRRENKSILESINSLEGRKKVIPDEPKHEEEFLKQLKEKIRDLNSKFKLKEQEVVHADEINKGIQKNVRALSAMLVDVPDSSVYNDGFLNSMKENVDGKKNRMSEISSEINIINEKANSVYDKGYVENLKSKIDKIRKLEKKIDDKIEKKEKEDKHYDVLQQLFSNKSMGIKKYIIEKMLDVFNDKINFYLPFFFEDPMEIIFNKDLEETIIWDGTEVTFAEFSSGEKTRLDLAIAFSLFMIVKTFFSTSVNLLIFDEILDQNLDAFGVEAVLNIIDNLTDDNSIIVISHRDEYKDNFTNQLLVKKQRGFSKLSVR